MRRHLPEFLVMDLALFKSPDLFAAYSNSNLTCESRGNIDASAAFSYWEIHCPCGYFLADRLRNFSKEFSAECNVRPR